MHDIITEQHIRARRATAAARRHPGPQRGPRRQARDLDDQLSRAESRAARAFAQSSAHSYDLAADIPELQAEIHLLEAASTCSPAAIYHPPDTAACATSTNPTAAPLTPSRAVLKQSKPLQLHPGADKAATLDALADTAHHHNNRILALTATDAATEYAAHNRYADTTTTPQDARTNIENKRWKLPAGSLVIVDDADHLQPNSCAGSPKPPRPPTPN